MENHGNNGGDGLAIARLLYQKGFDVDVFIDKSKKDFSKDAEINYHRLKEFLGIRILDFTDFNEVSLMKIPSLLMLCSVQD
ncbi:MAG: NAD(P)H-hydrate epimerase [Cloacibacterium normanense]